MTFGEQLKKARERKSLTQMQLATRTGLGIGTISNIERGDNEDPSLQTVLLLVSELGGSFAVEMRRGRGATKVVIADVSGMEKLMASMAREAKKG